MQAKLTSSYPDICRPRRATRTERGLVRHRSKRQRANTRGLGVHWQEDGHGIEGDGAEEDEFSGEGIGEISGF
jgi:hypothetical protein